MTKLSEIKIRGLTSEEKNQLREISKQRGSSSLNEYLVDRMRFLISGEMFGGTSSIYQEFLSSMREVQVLQLEKLEELIGQKQKYLESLKKTERLLVHLVEREVENDEL